MSGTPDARDDAAWRPGRLRIAFFGASELGYRCCEQLLDMGEEVVGLFSIPREFRISYSSGRVTNVTYRDFGELASEHDLPLVEVTSKMSDPRYADALRSWRPDVGIAVGWYYMIPRSVREIFPCGVLGIHASLLPKYRGGAPLVWAIINGERKAGVTLFYMDGGVDTGDVVAQKEFEILRGDTIREAIEKAGEASSEILREYVPLLREGRAPRVPQDHGAATQYPQRSPEDGRIDLSASAEAIRNFIRAQTRPYPGAFLVAGGKKIVIWDADVFEQAE